jgi:hypothetical protein
MLSTYYAVTGSVYSAATGKLRVLWTPAAEGTNTSYTYNYVATGPSGSLYRCFGTITIANTTAGSPALAPDSRYVEKSGDFTQFTALGGTAGQVWIADGAGSGAWGAQAGSAAAFTNYLEGDTEIVVTGDPRSGSNTFSLASAIARDSEVSTATGAVYTAAVQDGSNAAIAAATATFAPISVTIPAASNAALVGVTAGLAMTGPFSLSNPDLDGGDEPPLGFVGPWTSCSGGGVHWNYAGTRFGLFGNYDATSFPSWGKYLYLIGPGLASFHCPYLHMSTNSMELGRSYYGDFQPNLIVSNGDVQVVSNLTVGGTITEGGTALASKYALASVAVTNSGCTINGIPVTNGASLTISGTGAVSAADCTNIVVALAAPISVTIPAASNAALAGVSASYVPQIRTITLNGTPGTLTSNLSFTVAGGTDTTFTNWLGGDTEIVVAGDPRSGSNILSIASAIARDSEVSTATGAVYTAAVQAGSNAAMAAATATFAPISVTIPAASNAALAGVAASYMPLTFTNGAASGTNLTGSVFQNGLLTTLGSTLTSAGTNAVRGVIIEPASTVTNLTFWTGTTAAYEAIPTKNPSCLYFTY